MRKLFIIITILYLQFWCFTFTGSASERVYKPVFINRCGVVLYQLYISKTDEAKWEESLIDNILDRGESKRVTFKPTDTTCRWDLMARDQNGQEIIWKNVNLCTEKKLILHHKNGKSWIASYGETTSPPQSN